MISVILDCLAEGMSEQEIISEYPSLKKGDVQVAIKYAASLAREEIIPLSNKVEAWFLLFKLDENVPWILKKIIEEKGKHNIDSVFH